MWEVFDYHDAKPVRRVRWRWLARLLSRGRGLDCGLDYAREGEGW